MSKNFGSGNGGANQACSGCKHQRRKCTPDCKLAPFFPADRSKEFQSVHKVFGVCNTLKLLSKLETYEEKQRAVDSLCWEAACRDRNPVDGSLGFFNRQMEDFQKERQIFLKEKDRLQKELVWTKNLIRCYLKELPKVQQQYTETTGLILKHQDQHLNPSVYVPQDAYLQYPMSGGMSQAAPHYYLDAGIQGGTFFFFLSEIRFSCLNYIYSFLSPKGNNTFIEPLYLLLDIVEACDTVNIVEACDV